MLYTKDVPCGFIKEELDKPQDFGNLQLDLTDRDKRNYYDTPWIHSNNGSYWTLLKRNQLTNPFVSQDKTHNSESQNSNLNRSSSQKQFFPHRNPSDHSIQTESKTKSDTNTNNIQQSSTNFKKKSDGKHEDEDEINF